MEHLLAHMKAKTRCGPNQAWLQQLPRRAETGGKPFQAGSKYVQDPGLRIMGMAGEFWGLCWAAAPTGECKSQGCEQTRLGKADVLISMGVYALGRCLGNASS